MAQFDPKGNPAQSAYERIQPLLSESSLDSGIEAVLDFLGSYPDYAIAHNDIAVLYYRKEDKLRALAHHEKAVRLEPANLTFRRNLADFYFSELGWTDDAILIYTDILKKQPADTETLETLGVISLAVGRPDEARIFFKRVLEFAPGNISVRNALDEMDSPARLKPLIAPAPQPVADAPVEIDAILSELRETITSLEATTASDMYRKALELAEAGNRDAAIRQLEDLLAVEPTDAIAHNDLGVLSYQQGNLRKSLEHHETAVALAPSNPTFRKNLANLYYQELSRTDDAIQMYVELLKEWPNDIEVLSALTVICIANNRTEEAIVFLKKILELDPVNSDARNLLAQLGANDSFFLNSP